MIQGVTTKISTMLLAGSAGGVSAFLFALTLSCLVATNQNKTQSPLPLVITNIPPTPPTLPKQILPQKQLEQKKQAAGLQHPAKQTPMPAPRPAMPNLIATPALAATTGLALPQWSSCSFSTHAKTTAAPSRKKIKPFRWLYAPEKNDPNAIARRYPRYAARRGLEGEVVLTWRTAKNGEVIQAEVSSASPPGIFDRAALNMVKSWRGSRSSRGELKVKFRLTDLL